MNSVTRFIKIACTQPVVLKALKISFVVGTILNLINQGDLLISLAWQEINIFKLLLTYMVPYSVTTYTAVTMKLEFIIGKHAAISADLECKNCHAHVHVHENELIPECETCKVQTHWKAI